MKPRLDMIGITCKSIPDSIRFYEMLGLEFGDHEPDDPYIEAKLEDGIRLSLNDVDMIKQIDAEYVEPVGQRIGLAFLCGSPEEVDAQFKRITEAGFQPHKEPWDAFWGQRYAQILDPDGCVVDLFATLEK